MTDSPQYAPGWPGIAVPAFRLTNTCRQGRGRIVKEALTDPHRDVVLQQTCFVPLTNAAGHFQVYLLLAPHLGNSGWGNTAWVGDYKGVPMLFGERNGTALAVACSPPWIRGSAGFVGVSDGWRDLATHRTMRWIFDRAENGNVALTGAVDLATSGGTFVTALAFGTSAAEAGHRARATLFDGFDRARAEYLREWSTWQEGLRLLVNTEGTEARSAVRTSAAVLRCHEEKRLPGGIIASLSIPWGHAKGDNDRTSVMSSTLKSGQCEMVLLELRASVQRISTRDLDDRHLGGNCPSRRSTDSSSILAANAL